MYARSFSTRISGSSPARDVPSRRRSTPRADTRGSRYPALRGACHHRCSAQRPSHDRGVRIAEAHLRRRPRSRRHVCPRFASAPRLDRVSLRPGVKRKSDVGDARRLRHVAPLPETGATQLVALLDGKQQGGPKAALLRQSGRRVRQPRASSSRRLCSSRCAAFEPVAGLALSARETQRRSRLPKRSAPRARM